MENVITHKSCTARQNNNDEYKLKKIYITLYREFWVKRIDLMGLRNKQWVIT